MPFEQTVLPQYRDADPDGLIGLKGCIKFVRQACSLSGLFLSYDGVSVRMNKRFLRSSKRNG